MPSARVIELRCFGQCPALAQQRRAIHMRRQIAIADLEPRFRAQALQRTERFKRVAGHAPARLCICQSAQCVRHRIEIGADGQAVPLKIIARVDDHSKSVIPIRRNVIPNGVRNLLPRCARFLAAARLGMTQGEPLRQLCSADSRSVIPIYKSVIPNEVRNLRPRCAGFLAAARLGMTQGEPLRQLCSADSRSVIPIYESVIPNEVRNLRPRCARFLAAARLGMTQGEPLRQLCSADTACQCHNVHAVLGCRWRGIRPCVNLLQRCTGECLAPTDKLFSLENQRGLCPCPHPPGSRW